MLKQTIVALCLVSAACGREADNNPSEPTSYSAPGYPLVMLMEDRPACDATREGMLVYIAEDRSFYACVHESWYQIDLRGPAGMPGPPGNDGARGINGDKGPIGEGVKGDKGETGDTGATGPQGETGETGETGEKGEKGDTGVSA